MGSTASKATKSADTFVSVDSVTPQFSDEEFEGHFNKLKELHSVTGTKLIMASIIGDFDDKVLYEFYIRSSYDTILEGQADLNDIHILAAAVKYRTKSFLEWIVPKINVSYDKHDIVGLIFTSSLSVDDKIENALYIMDGTITVPDSIENLVKYYSYGDKIFNIAKNNFTLPTIALVYAYSMKRDDDFLIIYRKHLMDNALDALHDECKKLLITRDSLTI